MMIRNPKKIVNFEKVSLNVGILKSAIVNPWSAPKHEHKTSFWNTTTTAKKMRSTKVNHVGNFRHFRTITDDWARVVVAGF